MDRASRYLPWFVRVVVCSSALVAWSAGAVAQKTDIVTLNNGDTITCEIMELERGRLRCKTDAMGTVYIEWDQIADIDTDKTLEVELESGQRYFGSIKPADIPTEMSVTVGEASAAVNHDEVAFVRQINPTFWGKLSGGIDFGATFAQADHQLDYSLTASSKYTGRSNIFIADVSSLIKSRDEATTTNRQTFNGTWLRHLQWQRWFALTVTSLEHNEELDLDLRVSSGFGAGRYLAQTNRWTWAAYAAGIYSHEQFLGEETGNNNLEVGLGTNLQVFTFGDHDTDINTTFVVLPSVTDIGRVRLNLNAKIKREFVKDLYFSVDLFETYDSKPPQEGANKNDFGITMALGWSY